MTWNMVDLFTGIAGFTYAAEQVWGDDLNTVCFCEMDEFCQKVIRKHYPGVPIISDIRDVTSESITNTQSNRLEKRGVAPERQAGQPNGSGEIRKARIDLLTGGFPCQPFSCAGKQQGDRDDRFLWPEMLRVIRELQPTWIIGENVAGIINMALDQVLADLEGAGYQCQTFLIPACGVDAPHRRDRVWIVGHRIKPGLEGLTRDGENRNEPGRQQPGEERPVGETGLQQDVADTETPKRRRSNGEDNTWRGDSEIGGCGKSRRGVQHGGAQSRMGDLANGVSTWLDEPDTPRVATGVKDRVNRLKALGNSIVPQCVIPIMQAIKQIDDIR